MTTAKSFGALGVLALTAAVPCFAIFGFGDLVMDPTEWIHQVETTTQIGKEIAEVISVGTKILAETQEVIAVKTQLRQDAQFVNGKNIWRGYFMSAIRIPVADVNGETDGWYRAINTGLNAAQAQLRASQPLMNPPPFAPGSPLAVSYANAEIGSSAQTAAMQALGTAKTVQQQMLEPIGNCESSALSAAPANNTAAANANVANGCAALALRQTQTALGVDTARLEIETYSAKRAADQDIEYANLTGSAAQSMSGFAIEDTAAALAAIKDR